LGGRRDGFDEAREPASRNRRPLRVGAISCAAGDRFARRQRRFAMANDSLAGRKLVQVALTCRDLDRARTFYRDMLGLPLLFEAGHMLFFDMGGQRLMVGLSEKPEQPIGGTYIYFDAPDLPALILALKAKGVEMIGDVETLQRTDTHDLKLQFFKDPDDNEIGLMGMVAKA
jgi:catechol 2,3-dioxygenase-like lactoylglutathione lyase family enzyme